MPSTKVPTAHAVAQLDETRPVRVYRCGAHVELTQTAREIPPPPVRRWDATHHVIVETGELREDKRSESRMESPESVMKTVVRLRRIINANVSPNDCMLTLTYAQPDGQPMRDTERLMDDWERMRKRLVAMYGPHEYIAVLEPQKSGSWHLHVLLVGMKGLTIPSKKLEKQKLYTLNRALGLLWGQGFASIESLKDTRNPGLYLGAYLTNDGGKKRERLHFYPRGIRIYRCSAGIVRPQAEVMTWEAAQDLLGGAVPTYAACYRIETADGTTVQIVRQAFYTIEREAAPVLLGPDLDAVDRALAALGLCRASVAST